MPYNILLAWLTKTLTYDYDDQLTSTDGASFAYDAADRQTQQTAGNSSVTSFGYDSADRKTDVWHRASGGAALGRYGYAYDGAGNVSTRTDSDGSVTTFGYDGADQLTSEARTGTGAYTVGYTYDRNGNRMGKTQGGATDTYSYDAHDKLLSTSTKNYAYDNAGSPIRITSGGVVTTLAYDAEHRLTSLSGPASDTFTYNGLGLRVGKTDSGGTRSYVCDGTDAASAVLSDGAATYTPGLSERRGGASHFTHADALGTTRGLTDSTQGATDSLLFDGFGLPVSRSGSTPTPFGFVGAGQYQTDGDTGLLLLGHRYYDASTGRFLTADPAKAGDNWYDYCQNDSVNKDDPSGYQSTLDTPAGAAEIAQASPEELATLGRATGPKSAPTYPGEIPPDTPVYRGGETNPGNLTPQPGNETGLSFNLNPRDPDPSGFNAVTSVGKLVNNGFKVVNDWGDHVLVSIEDMGSWVNNRASDATQALKLIVTKIKVARPD